jgi:hypothetical protein
LTIGLSKRTAPEVMDIAATRRGDKNVATPQEMVGLLGEFTREVLNKQATAAL